MKVTAILPDHLVSQIQKETKGKNITQSLSIALSEWLQIRKTSKLVARIKKEPLLFSGSMTPAKIRNLNRS